MRIVRIVRNAFALALLAFIATGGGGPLALQAQGGTGSCPTCGSCTCCNCSNCTKGIFRTCSCGGCQTTPPPAPPGPVILN
jgi:hypothetical protein